MKNITLDEEGFQNREKFNSIIKKDADFFAVAVRSSVGTAAFLPLTGGLVLELVWMLVKALASLSGLLLVLVWGSRIGPLSRKGSDRR